MTIGTRPRQANKAVPRSVIFSIAPPQADQIGGAASGPVVSHPRRHLRARQAAPPRGRIGRAPVAGASMGPNVWHFRFGLKGSGRPARLSSGWVEVLRSDATGAWRTHLSSDSSIVIRRQMSGDGIHVGIEMYLPAGRVNIDDIELSELAAVTLRTHLEGLPGKRAQPRPIPGLPLWPCCGATRRCSICPRTCRRKDTKLCIVFEWHWGTRCTASVWDDRADARRSLQQRPH